jgi:VanZ family protein
MRVEDNKRVLPERSLSLRRIFYLTCVLIACASLFPFHFDLSRNPAGLITVFRDSLTFGIDKDFLRDVLTNLLAYIPVGFFFVLGELDKRPAWQRLLRATLAGATLSLAMESLQYWVPVRYPSLIDLLNNTISTAAGALLGIAFSSRSRRAFNALSDMGLGHPSSALFLLILWFASFFSPGDWGRFATFSRIRIAFHSPLLPPGLLFNAFAQWCVIGAILAAALTRKRAAGALALMATLTPLRFAIPGQQPHFWEFVAAASAVAIWLLPFDRLIEARWLAILACAGIVVEELRPWHFAARAGHFGWIPFVSLFESPIAATGLVILFSKAAVYGSAVWIVARAGFGLRRSAIAVAALLLALETTQLFLPSRTAETTDPLLALIIGLIMLRIERKYGGSSRSMPRADESNEGSEAALAAARTDGGAGKI